MVLTLAGSTEIDDVQWGKRLRNLRPTFGSGKVADDKACGFGEVVVLLFGLGVENVLVLGFELG